MGLIKINNEIYGTSNASDIVYKSMTVEEKLDTIPIFDINDNGNVDNSGSDVLTYGHIIDNLTSNATDKVLSANQGRVLSEKIDNIDLSYLEDGISTNTESINSLTNNLINLIYPVGSIYMSVNNVSPASFLGGTWEAIKDRFLLAAGSSYSAGSTGGAATVILTENEIPSHTHSRGTMNIVGSFNHPTWAATDMSSGSVSGAFTHGNGVTFQYTGMTDNKRVSAKFSFDASKAWTGETSSIGGDAAHNNMPPYLTVYIWKRIS